MRAMRRIAAALFDEEKIDQAKHRWELHRRNRGPHADVEATWHTRVKAEKDWLQLSSLRWVVLIEQLAWLSVVLVVFARRVAALARFPS